MRGEKQWDCRIQHAGRGSSPHARGKVTTVTDIDYDSRIIPACAGKRFSFCKDEQRAEDHPRMRGEKYTLATPDIYLEGSSPHARGKVMPSRCLIIVDRIIPACAGKSRITLV